MDKKVYVCFLCYIAASHASYNCPSQCICKMKEAIVYVGCSRRGYTSMPEDIPQNVTDLNFQFNSLTRLTSKVLSRFTHLEHAIFDYNQIDYIEPTAFYGLTRLARLDLSRNALVEFPWETLLRLPRLLLVDLNHNNLKSLPSDNRTLARLNHLKSLSLYKNSFVCSCNVTRFSKWLFSRPLRGSVNIPKFDQFECESELTWTKYRLEELSETHLKGALCKPPILELWALTANRSLSSEKNIFNVSVNLGDHVTVSCNYSASANRSVMKTAYMQGRVEQGFVISEVKAVNLNWTDANVVNITLDKTSQHNSLILCAVECSSGTVVKGVLLQINEVLQRQVLKDRREKIGKLVRYGNGSVNRTTPRIRNNDHIIPKIDKNISRCGESPGVPVTLLTPTNTSPVTYEFSLGKSFGEIRQNNADKTIDLYIFKPEDLEENLLYICHTHGPRILHRWSPLSDSNTAVKIQAQSSTQWFLVCLSLSSINEEACGNFTVVPSRGGNVMVMLIVGAVLMGFGTIPLLVAASQHAWHSRQEIAAARLRRTKPLLAKPVKRQLQTQASDNSRDIDSGKSSHILEGPRDANSPSLPIRELYNSKMITSRSNMKVNPTKSQLNGLCSYHSEMYDSGEKEAMLAAPADEDARNSGVQRWLNQVQLENWSEASQRDAYIADGHSVTEDYFDDRLNEV